ncbi:MAG: hypothetical protein HPY44_00145 [Armatimonadetes bacterium]|nr:hypothetical protein [Armatimonadota bacterium]
MKRVAPAVTVVVLLALAASAFAQGNRQGHGNRPDFDPSKSFAGTIVKVFKDSNGALKTIIVEGFQGRPFRQGDQNQTPPARITATIKVTSKTQYTKGREPASASIVKVGEPVFILLTAPLSNKTGTASRIGVMPKFEPGKMVFGTVTKVTRSAKGSLQSFEVKVTPPPMGPRGGSSQKPPAPFTAKITVNSATKYYDSDRKPTNSAGIKAGVLVAVALTAPLKDKAGTAATVGIAPKGRGPGMPGGRGGGPRGGGR